MAFCTRREMRGFERIVRSYKISYNNLRYSSACFSSCLSSAVKSVDNLCLILKRTVFRIGCSTETLAILPPRTTIRTYVFTIITLKKIDVVNHANVVFANDLIESLRSFVMIQKNQKIKSQICFPPHAGPPPHLARAIAPARN